MYTLQPSLSRIDLIPRNQAEWDLLEHLYVEGPTSCIPIAVAVVVASTDSHILGRVQQERDRYGGDSMIVRQAASHQYPLRCAIRTLRGPA